MNQSGWDEARMYIAIEDRDKYIDELEDLCHRMFDILDFYGYLGQVQPDRDEGMFVAEFFQKVRRADAADKDR